MLKSLGCDAITHDDGRFTGSDSESRKRNAVLGSQPNGSAPLSQDAQTASGRCVEYPAGGPESNTSNEGARSTWNSCNVSQPALTNCA